MPRLWTRGLGVSAPSLDKRVAVVLSGCGVYDGSELHEASACLVHLSRLEVAVDMYAPDVPQMHVIDHCKGEPIKGETRNVLVESARIARGKITPLSSLKAADYDGIVFPGGFGAAKNLCNFATSGADMTVIPDVERVLNEFHEAKKPIGLCCISPLLAAKVFPGVEVTVGSSDDPAAQAVNAMGGRHVAKDVNESHTDETNRVITAPAFMYGEAPLHDIFDGIGKMIAGVATFMRKTE